MLFEQIGVQNKMTDKQAIAKYWGEKIDSIPHPKYGYGCDAHPHGWIEISQEEFAQSSFFRYTALATAWSRTLLGDARMYFMHDDTGFALIGDYHGKKLSVFKFGCQHKFKEENVGNCLTKYICEKCGFAQTVDSSD